MVWFERVGNPDAIASRQRVPPALDPVPRLGFIRTPTSPTARRYTGDIVFAFCYICPERDCTDTALGIPNLSQRSPRSCTQTRIDSVLSNPSRGPPQLLTLNSKLAYSTRLELSPLVNSSMENRHLSEQVQKPPRAYPHWRHFSQRIQGNSRPGAPE